MTHNIHNENETQANEREKNIYRNKEMEQQQQWEFVRSGIGSFPKKERQPLEWVTWTHTHIRENTRKKNSIEWKTSTRFCIHATIILHKIDQSTLFICTYDKLLDYHLWYFNPSIYSWICWSKIGRCFFFAQSFISFSYLFQPAQMIHLLLYITGGPFVNSFDQMCGQQIWLTDWSDLWL